MWKPKALIAAAVLAAPLAFAAGANAADPPRGSVMLYNAAGVPVAILTPVSQQPAAALTPSDPAMQIIRELQASTALDDPFGFPFERLMAEQTAMMRQVMDEMRGMGASPGFIGPDGTLNVSMPGGQGVVREVVVSSFSSGTGSCSQTITYTYPGGAAQPQVAMHKVGDACGAVGRPDTQPLQVVQPPAPEQPAVPAAPTERIYHIKYRVPTPSTSPGYRG